MRMTPAWIAAHQNFTGIIDRQRPVARPSECKCGFGPRTAEILRRPPDAVLSPELHTCGEGTSLSTMSRGVVFPQQHDRKSLGARNSILFLRRKMRAYRKPKNIRRVSLKFILGPTFHLPLS